MSEQTKPSIGDQPAFPTPPCGDSITGEDGITRHQFHGCSGMTVRTWLAGQAMNGLLASLSGEDSYQRLVIAQEGAGDKSAMQTIVRAARMHAEGLIAELEKK